VPGKALVNGRLKILQSPCVGPAKKKQRWEEKLSQKKWGDGVPFQPTSGRKLCAGSRGGVLQIFKKILGGSGVMLRRIDVRGEGTRQPAKVYGTASSKFCHS